MLPPEAFLIKKGKRKYWVLIIRRGENYKTVNKNTLTLIPIVVLPIIILLFFRCPCRTEQELKNYPTPR